MNMYGKCGCVEESRKIFDGLVSRDLICWTAMISIHANHGQSSEALQVFLQMQQAETSPNEATFVSILKACTSLGYVITGQVIHHWIYANGFELHVMGVNALIHLYNKCGSVEDAERTFESMSKKDVGTWNSIISVYATHNKDVEALIHFVNLLESGLIPNSVTFISVLPICRSTEMLLVGEWLNSLILDLDLESDTLVSNGLLAMYCKCDRLESAHKQFHKMPSRDVVSWNTLISAYSQQGNGDIAFKQLKQMEHEGVPFDKVTFVLILALCGSNHMLSAGKQVHVSIQNLQLDRDLVVGNALVGMYSRCGDSEHAWIALDKMHVRDALSYGPIIDMLIEQGNIKHAFQTFEQLLQECLLPSKATFVSIFSACAALGRLAPGRGLHACIQSCHSGSNMIILNALLCLYSKMGKWGDAWWLFETASGRDRVSWNTMITSCACQGFGHKAIHMFDQMRMEGEFPDKVTFLATVSACGHLLDLKEGMYMHTYVHGTEFSRDLVVGNALVSMYGRCGRIEHAKDIFNELISTNNGLVTTWNVMISVYANQGQGTDALLLFHQMQQCGEMATPLTYVSILSVCASIIGLAEGIMMHGRIQYSGFGKAVAVENALINMYGKWGDMTAAQKVFDNMPVQDLISWTTVISNYAQHGQIPEAMSHYKRMQSKGLFPNDVTILSMLNGYSHTGLLDPCFGLVLERGGVSLAITDHFVSIIDLLVRAGQLEEANHLIKMLPFEPSIAMFMTVLAGYRQNVDIAQSEYAAMKVFELDPDSTAAHIILSNIYMTDGGDAKK